MTEETTYTSLEAIARRKRKLHGEIAANERSVRHLWRGLVHPARGRNLSTRGRMTSLLATGGTIVDGALLAWKLYRKFKR